MPVMRSRIGVVLAIGLLFIAAGASAAYGIWRIANPGFKSAILTGITDVVAYPGSPEELLVLTQKGRITRVSVDGGQSPQLFADLSDRLGPNLGFEEGLLGLAFSPTFAEDSYVYVNYTAGRAYTQGATSDTRRNVISRFLVSDGLLDVTSETVLLEIPQPGPYHNGGQLAFGPDGYLYIGVGDGGGHGDPNGSGQNVATFLGTILRIDVGGNEGSYTVPPDNPLVGSEGVGEIFAYGLRNPWRFSFDGDTGQLWAGDVGQNAWEEIDLVTRGGNYGWNCYEGFERYAWTDSCETSTSIPPRAVYAHNEGCAVIGGYVYRGTAQPEIYGRYVYGDYCTGRIWTVDPSDPSSEAELFADTDLMITGFAELSDGELVVADQRRGVFAFGPRPSPVIAPALLR